MSDKKVFLVLLDEMPCPGSHYLHTKKFLQAFSYSGYSYHEIFTRDQISQISPGDIVYISNHGMEVENPNLGILQELANRRAKYILWFWHFHLEIAKSYFGDNFVITGEHFHFKPVLEGHLARWNVQESISNYVPLTFASKLFPDQIGTLPRSDKYLAHFIGANYKKTWNRKLQILHRRVKIINTPPFIEESERENIFLSSGIALGWHSDGNIENHVVVERIFEGISYGNFVVSDNPTAHEITDGIVETAYSFRELQDHISRFKKDKEFGRRKQADGYSWAKKHGTYVNVAEKFIQALNN